MNNSVIDFAKISLEKTTGYRFTIEERGSFFEVILNGNGLSSPVKLKGVFWRNLTTQTIGNLIERHLHNRHDLFIIPYVNQNLGMKLHQARINFIDASGNCRLFFGNYLNVLVLGQPRTNQLNPQSMDLYSKTNVRLLYYYLTQPESLSLSVRDLSSLSEVSTGSISNFNEQLIKEGYILKKNGKNFLIVSEKLVDDWIRSFNVKLRPDYTRRYTWRNGDPHISFIDSDLHSDSAWGGEIAGAQLIDDAPDPASFDKEFIIYTRQTTEQLIKNYKLVPDAYGPVMVISALQPFQFVEKPTLAHPLLVAADLMISMEPRWIEVAKSIKLKYLLNH